MTAVAQRANNRVEAVLDAAAEHFATKGFKETTTRDIAAAADMLPGSIYYHFATKDDLLLAVYEEGVRRIEDAVETAVSDIEAPWEQLEAVMRAHLETILSPTAYARVLIRVLPDSAPKIAGQLKSLRDSYERRVAAVVDRLPLRPEADRNLLRLFIMGAANHTQVWYRPGPHTPATIAAELVRMFRGSLEAEAA